MPAPLPPTTRARYRLSGVGLKDGSTKGDGKLIGGARQLPPRHISIRVPWSDVAWEGRVCLNPKGNNACLVLKRIATGRSDDFEEQHRGEAWSVLEGKSLPLPPCANEHGAFMSKTPHIRRFNHPYVDFEPAYANFRETIFEHKPYSAACIPFRWMLRKKVEGTEEETGLAESLGIGFDPRREPRLEHVGPTWVQERRNQLVLLDTFFAALKPKVSLCFFYAKRTPLSEDPRRVIVGVGRVTGIGSHVEYGYANSGEPSSVVWERNVHHSIRPIQDDGFLLPYEELANLADNTDQFDPARTLAYAPEDHWEAFSYGSELVSDDAAIAGLASVLRSLETLKPIVSVNISNAIAWVNGELNRLWRMRGPYPGLGSALTAFGIDRGTLVAFEIEHALRDEKSEWSQDPWQLIDVALEKPELLPTGARQYIGDFTCKLWKTLPEDRRALLKLISRLDIDADQATRLYEPAERERHGITCSDEELLDNPYRIYELDRRAHKPISVETVDRGAFPSDVVRERFPLPKPSCISETSRSPQSEGAGCKLPRECLID